MRTTLFAASAPALAAALLLTTSARAQAPEPPFTPPPEAQPGAVIVVVPPAPPTLPPPQYVPVPEYVPPPQFLPPAAPPPPVRRDRGFSFKLQGGPSYQRVFDTSISGFEGGVWFGGVRGISGVYGGMDFSLGSMQHGLFTYAIRPGATWEARLGVVHLGVGGQLTMIAVDRATNQGSMVGLGGGLTGFITVDLIKGERSSLFLGGRIRVDLLTGSDANGDSPILWGPSAMLGWRFR